MDRIIPKYIAMNEIAVEEYSTRNAEHASKKRFTIKM